MLTLWEESTNSDDVEVGAPLLLRNVMVQKTDDLADTTLHVLHAAKGDQKEVKAITRLTTENALTERMREFVNKATQIMQAAKEAMVWERSRIRCHCEL